jgi:hypothetical protein
MHRSLSMYLYSNSQQPLTWAIIRSAYEPSLDRERAVPAYLTHADMRSATVPMSHYAERETVSDSNGDQR